MESKAVSPVVKWTFPAPVHLVSLTPRIASLNLFISLSTWCTFPAWYIVRTFHVPIRVQYLGENIFGLEGVMISPPVLGFGWVKVTSPSSPRGPSGVGLAVVFSLHSLGGWLARGASHASISLRNRWSVSSHFSDLSLPLHHDEAPLRRWGPWDPWALRLP